jgi:hypothetical protein
MSAARVLIVSASIGGGRAAARVVAMLTALLATVALAQPASVDVVVLGSEPEAIAAAVAAAESGADTWLVTPDARLGGLFTLGALNVLDVRTAPASLQRGLFERWWARVGRQGAFDPSLAASVFEALLSEAGVRVVRDVRELTIVVRDGRAVGARWSGGEVAARQVVDGDADLDHLVAAGASASFGWAAFGLDRRMADTLVFRIDGVDWAALRAEAARRGSEWARVDRSVAWGDFGGVPAAYPASSPDLRLRGLNLGRDEAGGVWVNALLIHGVDPFDPSSRARARELGTLEAERIVRWLAPRLPGFASARLGAVAERLYVRETRHLDALCVLDADHLLDHRSGPFDVAVGGYPLDLQSLTRFDRGFVFGTPERYGVPLCVSVPAAGPDAAWGVGRSIGYDPVAHASTRVVPLGMAVAEGVGVAAARAAGRDEPLRRLALDVDFVASVRDELRARGAYLPAARPPPPVGPTDHPHHRAYRRMLSRGLALGGYANEPDLDAEVPALSLVYLTAEVVTRFGLRHDVAVALVDAYGGLPGPAGAAEAAVLQHAAACRLDLPCPDRAEPGALASVGLWPAGVPGDGPLTRGEGYAVAALLADALAPPDGER